MKIHGGNIYKHTHLLDFSANINPLGMPDSVREAIVHSAADCMHYPDPDCTVLIQEIAKHEQISTAKIVCGNGAADLIYRIVRAVQPKQALICAPTFSEYRDALHEIGCNVIEYPLDDAQQFVLDDRFLRALFNNLDMIFLCTPNNPTGKLIDPDLLKKIAAYCSKNQIILICDECFLRFCAHAETYSLRPYLYANCIILNAFTKLYAMPGIRLGYALCGSEQLAEKIRNTGQFWSVSVPAQAAGIAALNESGWIENTVAYVSSERCRLTNNLRESGVFVYDGTANFLLLKSHINLVSDLEQREILIRSCNDFSGLSKEHFRIAVRTISENNVLLSAVREVYAKCGQL